MTEAQVRAKVVKAFTAWLGYKESDGSYKKIIDIYNAHMPLARSYKVKYTDEWCAAAGSAAAIEAGLTDIIPTECGCGEMLQLFRDLGRWKENDGYEPQPGDYIFYDWDDKGKGDNKGYPDHVGVVASVSGDVIKVIEGNKSDAVGYRYIAVNGKYIRGFGIPDYAGKVTVNPYPEPTRTIYYDIISKKVVCWGDDVKYVQQELIDAGIEYVIINGKKRKLKADGSCGPITDIGIRIYQKDHDLVVDGRVGPATREALKTD